MLEIIALIILTKQIGKLAADKGLKPGTWKLYLVLAWIVAELIGLVIGVLIFGPDNIFSIMLVGIAGAVTGYFIIKSNLSKKPDVFDDIDQIGANKEG
jgi:hypothetical protein